MPRPAGPAQIKVTTRYATTCLQGPLYGHVDMRAIGYIKAMIFK